MDLSDDCSVDDTIELNDPGVSQCLSTALGGSLERQDYVALGNKPVCIYQWNETKRICYCPEAEDGVNCTSQCPIVKQQNTTCSASFASLVGGKTPSQWSLPWSANGTTETASDILVSKTLNIYNSDAENTKMVPRCDLIWSLAYNYGSLSKQQIKDQIEEIQSSNGWWLNPVELAAIASTVKEIPGLLNHWELHANGKTWTTNHSNPTKCPVHRPWFESASFGGISTCVQDNPSPDLETWYEAEYDISVERVYWAQKVHRAVNALKVLSAGGLTNTYSRATADDLSSSSNALDLFTGYGSSPLLWAKYLFGQSDSRCDTIRGCTCLNWNNINPFWGFFDDEISVCDKYLYPCKLHYNTYGSISGLENFWRDGLTDFLSQSLASTDVELARLHWVSDNANNDNYCGYGQSDLRVVMTGGPGMSYYIKVRDADGNDIEYPDSFQDLHRGTFYLSGEAVIDAMGLACNVVERNYGACATMPNPNTIPPIESRRDLSILERHARCTANAIIRVAETIVLTDLPQVLVEGFQRNGIDSHYPGWQGEMLKALLNIEADLRKFASAKEGISTQLLLIGNHIEFVRLNLTNIELKSKLQHLNLLKNAVVAGINAVSGIISSGGSMSSGMGGISAIFGNVMNTIATETSLDFDEKMQAVQDDILEVERELALVQGMSDIVSSLANLRAHLDTIRDTFRGVQSALSTFNGLQRKAAEAWAVMTLQDTDTAGHVLHVNTVMRRRQNTARVRYQKALARAKKLSFIARRAIEFRLGVNMNEITKDMTLVEAPSKWADLVCALNGFDYTAIRNATPLDELYFAENLTEHVGVDNYAQQYIGDYVRSLKDFVESYNIDYPFSDEDDLAVLSLKSDLKGARVPCMELGYNLVYYSDMVGHNEGGVGWEVAGCAVNDPGCISSISDSAASPFAANRIYNPQRMYNVAEEAYTRPEQYTNTGYYKQSIYELGTGDYILSWYDKSPDTTDGYHVEVIRTYDGSNPETIYSMDHASSTTQWYRSDIKFTLANLGEIEIHYYPNRLPSQDGSIWIRGVQLEYIDDDRLLSSGGSLGLVEPLEPQPIEGDRNVQPSLCYDAEGVALRSDHFEHKCVCSGYEGGVCPSGPVADGAKSCFYEATFDLYIDDVENGDLIQSNSLALGNYNYRHDAVAMNIIGTNVRDCSASQEPGSCYSNAFLPYTLEHNGTVPVRNYDGDSKTFFMPTARIQYGKALASEVVVTNPISGSHTTLLQPYWKTGLRGRPLQGSYTLRIYDLPELNWNVLEDIQIVFKYRYWTRMTNPDWGEIN